MRLALLLAVLVGGGCLGPTAAHVNWVDQRDTPADAQQKPAPHRDADDELASLKARIARLEQAQSAAASRDTAVQVKAPATQDPGIGRAHLLVNQVEPQSTAPQLPPPSPETSSAPAPTQEPATSDQQRAPATATSEESPRRPSRYYDVKSGRVPEPPGEEVEEEAAKNKPVVEVVGSIQADAIMVSQTLRDKLIIGDVANAYGFRRARLGATGDVGEQVHWAAVFDFAGGDIAFKDVYIAVDKLPVLREVRVGNFDEPFSLEGATSSNNLTFIERSSAYAIDPARHWGVGFFSYTEDRRLTFEAGAFRSGSNSAGDDFGDGNDMQYAFRITGLPWYEDRGRYLMHMGAAFVETFPKNNEVTFNQGPQSSLLSVNSNQLSPFIKNITIPANNEQLYNAQWALVLGPLSFQAEWNAAYVEQIGGGPVFLHGGYVFASWFLTGENRGYVRRYGEFGLVEVRRPFMYLRKKCGLFCGPGAWELAARWQYVNFSDPDIPPQNGLKVGNKLAEGTFGVNWYLNSYTRIMFNYDRVVPVDPNFGPSGADAFFIQTAIFW
jgi:phosphate-selective porin OprO/OprP